MQTETPAHQLSSVAAAFSRQSSSFDAIEEASPIHQWMRAGIRKEVMRFLRPGDRMLELNAGTGMDAAYFAQQGVNVLATDIAEGMQDECRRKAAHLGLEDRIRTRQCSYTDLTAVEEEGPFDYVFSNFGGLNCIPDLKQVTEQLPRLLRPGGHATFVLMPPVCPWEMALALKGNFRIAFRRLKRGGAPSHLEGVHFTTWYFTPQEAMAAFGKDFEKVSLKGLASVAPPPYLENFPTRLPGIFRALCRMDERVAFMPPFNSWADHYMLTVRRVG